MPYRLLDEFENTFAGRRYLHRNATLGDFIAIHLYEDLLAIDRSEKLIRRIRSGERVINVRNLIQGKPGRRGDATLGESIPGAAAVQVEGFEVLRSIVATIEIGAETKILAKAMIKQIDRVISDLQRQTEHFRRLGNSPICVAFVGINFAPYAVSYGGDRANPTDGKRHKHPIQEAHSALSRLRNKAAPSFDEVVVLKYLATNQAPFEFEWVNHAATENEYGAALVRISGEYDRRF